MFFLFLKICFWLCWVFIAVFGLSLVAVIGGHYPVTERGLLIMVASRCGTWALCAWVLVVAAHGIQNMGSLIETHRLSCSEARGIFPCIARTTGPLDLQGSPPWGLSVLPMFQWSTVGLLKSLASCSECSSVKGPSESLLFGASDQIPQSPDEEQNPVLQNPAGSGGGGLGGTGGLPPISAVSTKYIQAVCGHMARASSVSGGAENQGSCAKPAF